MNPAVRSPLILPYAPATLTPSLTLATAAAQARDVSAAAAALEPDHWRSPAAREYTRRVRDLARAIESAADVLDAATASARGHELALDHVRQALLTGAPVPV
ncbi:hypothetical protein LQF12_15535 [Ruania suaedae]|uniref:hypothetical protein n=1 Tax=Ruania suaedae TaxID=2897774 RepID=UPI001E49FA55|nr:hypothetical protein [Ruania suaedae]UFU02876.1 hypothetical protein LQF12_15535 [Ruania suaedae]